MTARLLLTVEIHVIIVLTLTPTHMRTQTHTQRDYEENQVHIGFHMINSGSLSFLTDIYGVKQL